jgi:hypothetical protein
MRCERCGRPGADILGEVILCEPCLGLVLREWKIHFAEFGDLQGTEGIQGHREQ